MKQTDLINIQHNSFEKNSLEDEGYGGSLPLLGGDNSDQGAESAQIIIRDGELI